MIHERMLEENWGMNYLIQAVKLSVGSVESCRGELKSIPWINSVLVDLVVMRKFGDGNEKKVAAT